MSSLSKYDKKRFLINNAFKKFINPSIPNLSFTDKEIDYISNPFHCKWRNQWLSSNNDIHHICDAYACIGGDTIQFMAIKPNAIINAIQITESNNHQLNSRFQRLVNNIKNTNHLNPNISLFDSSISNFINNHYSTSIDFLYCDPPWTDSNDNWYDSSTLISNLYHDIIIHLNSNNYSPKYICFKVPFNWDEFKIILNHLPNYIHNSSGEFFYNKYWFHVVNIK